MLKKTKKAMFTLVLTAFSLYVLAVAASTTLVMTVIH